MNSIQVGGQIDNLVNFLKFLKGLYGDLRISEITAEQIAQAAQVYKDSIK